MQQRRDTSANWVSNNPVLLAGEIGVETDSGGIKVGDGSATWVNLDYIVAPRVVASATISVAAGGVATDTIELFRGAVLYSVEVDKACWLRLYNNASNATADAGRNRTTDPDPASGVIFEIITTGADTIVFTPNPLALNAESPASSTYTLRVTNDAGTADVAVDITYVTLFN